MRKIIHLGNYFCDIKKQYGRIIQYECIYKNFKIILGLKLLLEILVAPSFTSLSLTMAQAQQAKQVTLTAIVAEPKDRWDTLFATALAKLREKHPDMTINIDYRVLPYDDTKKQILTAMAGKTPIDLISVDQIWLGSFAEGGFLSDLT